MNIFDFLGMGGLIKDNLKVYFDSIKDGINHKDALMVVLKSRYPFEPGKSREVALRWERPRMAEAQFDKTKPPTEKDVEKDELRDLIHTMYSVEAHLDRADVFKRIKENEKFDDKFNELYDPMKTKYKVKEDFPRRTTDKGKVSERVTIEPKLILAFVGDLGIHVESQFWVQAGKDPNKKPNAREEKEFGWIRAIVPKSIAKGFILAKHQPELAAALVEQMNREKPGSADEILGDVLAQYKLSLAKNLADRWESSKAPNQGVLKSDLTRGRNEMSEKVTIEPALILEFVRDLGAYAAVDILGIPKLDPINIPKVVGRKARDIQVIGDIVSLAITRGLILTNYQRELAAALVEQINQERAGFADEQLREMLFVYHSFLYQKARGIS